MENIQIQVGYSHIPITLNDNKAFNGARVTFINKGTQTVTISGCFPLAAGDSITYPEQDPREINRTVYNIIFANEDLPGCLLIAIVKNVLEVTTSKITWNVGAK